MEDAHAGLLFSIRRNWRAYVYLLPMIVVLLFLNLYPIAYTFYISLTDFGSGGPNSFFNVKFIGLSNYFHIFYSSYYLPQTIALLQNSVVWATGSIAIFIPLGLLLASLLNQPIRGKWIYRTVILIPWAMPAFISLLTWENMLNYEYGIVNSFLNLLHLPSVNWLGGSPLDVWSALFLTNTWLSFPFYTIVFLAAMQAIPSELYESAQIDGAGTWRMFSRITVPYILPTVLFVGITGWLFTFNNFYPIYLLTSGGPGFTSEIFVVEIYQTAFQDYSFAIAATYSVINFLILLVVAVIAIKYARLTQGWLK
jgi:arabinogalactan oligomer/maltooligosaccharide transport system permease protein